MHKGSGSGRKLARLLGIPLLLAVLAVLVLFPVGNLLYATFRSKSPVYPDATWSVEAWTTLAESDFRSALIATLLLAAVVGTTSTLLGSVFAWLVTRTDIPRPGIIEFGVFVPFLLSPFVLATGWIGALRPHAGLINVWILKPLFGTELNIYSWWGIAVVMITYLTPVTYLFIAGALRSADGSLEEASQIAGASRFRTARCVTLPMAAPAIAAAGLLVTVQSAEMFSVPALLGRPFNAPNLAVWVYERVLESPPMWTSAAAGGSVLVVIVGIGVWLNRRLLGASHKYMSITGKASRPRQVELGRWRRIALALAIGYTFLCIGLPVLTIIGGSFLEVRDPSQLAWSSFGLANYDRLLSQAALNATRNTVLLSVGVPLVVIAITLASAHVVTKSQRAWIRGVIDSLNTLPLAFPGLVLGVAVLWAYFPIVWLPVYGTILLLFVAYAGRYLPQSYRNLSAGLIQKKPELEEASQICGASPGQTFRHVTMPLLRPTLTYTYIFLLVEVSKEVTTAVILGAAGGIEALAPLMWETLAEGTLGHAYVLSVLQLVITGIAVLMAQKFLGVNLSSRRTGVRASS